MTPDIMADVFMEGMSLGLMLFIPLVLGLLAIIILLKLH